MRTSKLDQKICLVDRSMKINCPKSSFYSQKLVLEMKKKQVPACCLYLRGHKNHNSIFENWQTLHYDPNV